jgi:dTDP-4-dehydrorhamnose reductase
MKKIKVFITGHSGMLAIEAAKLIAVSDKFELVDTAGLEFYTNPFHYINNRLIKSPEVDITDESILDMLYRRLQGEEVVILHTAAYVNTDKCEQFSYEAVKSNVYGTQLLINLAKKLNAFFVYCSTTAVFDPDEYMKRAGTFDETAKINPKTIYGLTKYLGEIAIKQSLPKEKYIVLKPVFFYGDAPNDNSSMLRKILEQIYLNKKDKKLNVLLDPEIEKDYCRSEVFADMLMTLLNSDFNYIAGKDYIISRDKPEPFKYYLDIIEGITKIDNIYDYINIIPEKDYLKRHNGLSNNFYERFPDYKIPDWAFFDNFGISKTFESIKRLYENF